MRVSIAFFRIPPPWVIEKEKSRRRPADDRQPAHVPAYVPEYRRDEAEDQQREGKENDYLVSLI